MWGQLLGSALPGLLGGLGGGGDTGPRLGSADMIRQSQARTQGLVDKQLGMADDLMSSNENGCYERSISWTSYDGSKTSSESSNGKN